MSAFRGIFYGLAFSTGLWAAIFLLVFMVAQVIR